MNELEQVSMLIGDIYDAALDRALWGNVLEQTCQFVNGYNAGLLAHDLVQDKGHLHVQWGADPRYVEFRLASNAPARRYGSLSTMGRSPQLPTPALCVFSCEPTPSAESFSRIEA